MKIIDAYEKYSHQDYQGAQELLTLILKHQPTDLSTLLLLGCTSYCLGNYNESIDYNQRILSINPDFPEAYCNLGTTFRAMGELSSSEYCYRKALVLSPTYWDAAINLATLLSDQQRWLEAIDVYSTLESCFDLQPDKLRDIRYAKGSFFLSMNYKEEAKEEFKKALELVGGMDRVSTVKLEFKPIDLFHHPTTASILNMMASLCEQEEAIHYYYLSLKSYPTPDTCNNLGILLAPQNLNLAIQWYHTGLSLNAQHPHLYTNLGSALKEQGLISEAIDCYKKALQHFPNFYIALGNLANVYKDQGNFKEAISYYQKALKMKPDFYEAKCQLVHACLFICDWSNRSCWIQEVSKIVDFQLSTNLLPSVLPFHTFIYPFSPTQIYSICQQYASRLVRLPVIQPLRGSIIHIGYVSSDFRDHPLSHLMESVFQFHDRNYFKIYCYSLSLSDGSSYRQRIEKDADVFVDVSNWSLEQILLRIQEDNISILINLNGYTKGARNELFASKPCPIQVSLMYTGTLGGGKVDGWMDYIVADPIVLPQSQLEYFDEKPIYMPHSFFVNNHANLPHITDWEKEVQERRMMRQQLFPDVPLNWTIFANFNQLYKLDPETFCTWCRILVRVPTSILWLLTFPPEAEFNLKQFAHTHFGPLVADRILFTPVAPKQEHVSRGRIVDLFLDTSECNAHTTAADILWSGTPLLTFPKYSYKMCSRVAASLCYATGHFKGKPLGDLLVVDSLKMYEDRAVELIDQLMDIRCYLYSHRDSLPVFDTRRWVNHFEKGLLKTFDNKDPWIIVEE